MYRISSNGIVTVNRGDSFELPVNLHIGNFLNPDIYNLKESDTVYLGIMEPNQMFETAIVRKKFTYEDYLNNGESVIFRFFPQDTCCLLPGKYYYQIKLSTINPDTQFEDVETIVDKTLFYIQE